MNEVQSALSISRFLHSRLNDSTSLSCWLNSQIRNPQVLRADCTVLLSIRGQAWEEPGVGGGRGGTLRDTWGGPCSVVSDILYQTFQRVGAMSAAKEGRRATDMISFQLNLRKRNGLDGRIELG